MDTYGKTGTRAKLVDIGEKQEQERTEPVDACEKTGTIAVPVDTGGKAVTRAEPAELVEIPEPERNL